MTGRVRGRGFFVGAVGGLALALLVVGAASFLPHSTPTFQALSAPGQSVPASSPPGQGGAAVTAGNAAASITSSTTGEFTPQAAASTSQAQQRPDSLLAVLPGEGAGSLIATFSPLLVGLLVAALVYGAYVRRQDASS